MIPQIHITDWSAFVPWQTNEQIEQDLVISRALVEIFRDDFLAQKLAFRGGTALHKLFIQPQPRYSEDIDLVQIEPSPIGEVLDRLRKALNFIEGKTNLDKGDSMTTLIYKFQSEIQPVSPLKLKIEINCREHLIELGWLKKKFKVESDWYKGECDITTYQLEELLGTKLRALYQRRKGRDLYDLYKVLTSVEVNKSEIIHCFKSYIRFSTNKVPSQKEIINNMEAKMKHDDFLGDITALIRQEEKYDQNKAYELIRKELIEKI
ncbi:MAG: nucleotidyltransferase [Flavobacteria bacterium RIFCSPLOWO2_12_FULL_35_11]|nr:MAG: nucleotidyltransferase [Flavobacteria bacterium RIFCSPLOWO2_12_FULL_35_11]